MELKRSIVGKNWCVRVSTSRTAHQVTLSVLRANVGCLRPMLDLRKRHNWQQEHAPHMAPIVWYSMRTFICIPDAKLCQISGVLFMRRTLHHLKHLREHPWPCGSTRLPIRSVRLALEPVMQRKSLIESERKLESLETVRAPRVTDQRENPLIGTDTFLYLS